MKVHLRADSVNGAHVRITVFLNGANCGGQLTMCVSEGLNFHDIVAAGCANGIDSFVSSGHWIVNDDEKEAGLTTEQS